MFDFLDIVDIEAAFEMIDFDAYNEKRSFLVCFLCGSMCVCCL